MGLYNRAIRTQRTPDRPGTHEGVLKKLLRTNPDTRRYASNPMTVPGPPVTVPGPPVTVPGPPVTVPGPPMTVPGPPTTVVLTAQDVEKKKN